MLNRMSLLAGFLGLGRPTALALLLLIVSPAGDVVSADASGDGKILKFWPQLKNEVSEWKFMPFQKDGISVTAEVEEYIDLVPPEQLPRNHVTAPALRPNSQVAIK